MGQPLDQSGNLDADLREAQMLLINGVYSNALSDAVFPVLNPMTGKEIYKCASGQVADYEAAIVAAHNAFKTWSATPPSSRRSLLLKAADILDSYLVPGQSGISANTILSAEVSATKPWIELNVKASANFMRDSASLATHIKGEVLQADRPNTTVLVMREAVGVVFSICPWNAPLNLTARAIATPLICGNTVIIKASEFAPKSQHLVVRALVAAGIPPGVINFMPTSPADAAAVTEFTVKHPFVRRVNFTGSDRVGTIIAGWAASVMKPCIFELGGKAPFLVLDDANIEDAVQAAAFGGLNNSGQICMSTERVILCEEIAAEFKTALVRKVETISCGNHYENGEVSLSGLSTPASAQRVLSLVKKAISQGAELLIGDLQVSGPNGTVMKPHILDKVTMEMEISSHETFGPVLCLYQAASADEAVAIANQSDFSLCASVYSKDLSRALAIAKQVRAGSMHINGPTIYIEPPLPNGGTGGRSGYGRFGGISGIEEFTEKKVISIAHSSLAFPF